MQSEPEASEGMNRMSAISGDRIIGVPLQPSVALTTCMRAPQVNCGTLAVFFDQMATS